MDVKDARYELTAVRPEQYPKTGLPEIAFAGRSNVGKSSAINCLVSKKNLARVGSTPGKTREINFYNVNGKLYFVDLPGYGYAKVSKKEKLSWGQMAETYFNSRKELVLVLLLVDIRHEPTEDDKVMYNWLLQTQTPHIVLACKSDKISRSRIATRIEEISKALMTPENVPVIPFSSQSGQGRNETWKEIQRITGL